jgi:predicted Fe-Mo cluster-binding NifX family protein
MRLITLITVMISMTWMLCSHQDIVNQDDKKVEIIAIPAPEKNIDALVYEHFSRSPFFCLYNTKTGSRTFVENPQSRATEGGSRRVVQLLLNNGVGKIYLVKAGDNALSFLNSFGIRTEIVPAGKSIREIAGIKLNEVIEN